MSSLWKTTRTVNASPPSFPYPPQAVRPRARTITHAIAVSFLLIAVHPPSVDLLRSYAGGPLRKKRKNLEIFLNAPAGSGCQMTAFSKIFENQA